MRILTTNLASVLGVDADGARNAKADDCSSKVSKSRRSAMITIQSNIHVDRISGMEIFNFLINPTDREYQRWWPGTHIELHNIKHGANNIGNIVYMDEFIGEHRVKMTGIVIEAEPGKKIMWRLKKFVRLPIWLSLEFEDDHGGVAITHTIRAGFAGIGRIFDVLLRFYFSDEFGKAMDEHVKTEFPKLREMLLGEM